MKDDMLKKIEDLYDLDKHQEIIDMIEALPAEQLNNELIGQLGRAYNNVGKYEKAIEILKSIEIEEGNTMRWNYRIGYSYYYLGDYENAEKYFLKAHKIDSEDEDVKRFLLDIYIELSKQAIDKEDNQDKALEYALKSNEYISTNDDRIQCDSYLAWLYDKIGVFDVAEELLKNIISLGRDDAWLNSQIGWNLLEEDVKEALKYLNKAKDLGKDDAWINRQFGFAYSQLGEYEKAISSFKKARELGANDSWLLYQLGLALKEYGNIEEAINIFKEEIEITDYKGFGDLQLAWCYALIDEKEKAKEYFKNVDKYLSSSLKNDEELRKDYNTVKELINSTTYIN